MNYSHGRLTSQQVTETFFIVPDLSIILCYGSSYFDTFRKKRRIARATGGELNMIGWPDGSTITLARTNSSDPLDSDNLLALYRLNASFNGVIRKKGQTDES